MADIDFGGGIWLLAQAALLVLFYGGVCPSMPWWAVWFPTLIIIPVLAIGGIILLFVWLWG